MDNNMMHELLEQNRVFADMFDVVRMVDAQEGKLLEYVHGAITETAIRCTDVFCSSERCRNCTSSRAQYAGKTMVKLEYASDAVLLIMSVPITHEGRRVVIELVKNISDSMTVDVQDQFRLNEVSSIIVNLNKIASTDALTGLFNRRYIDDTLPELTADCQKNSQSLYAAMIDIDNFKCVNDLHGHLAGDRVISSIGRAISRVIRRGADWAARYGGEEFFVCFAGVEREDFLAVLERLRREIEDARVPLDGQPGDIGVTVSIGAGALAPGDCAATFVGRCDRMLYKAKKGGKNRVEMHDSEDAAFG